MKILLILGAMPEDSPYVNYVRKGLKHRSLYWIKKIIIYKPQGF